MATDLAREFVYVAVAVIIDAIAHLILWNHLTNALTVVSIATVCCTGLTCSDSHTISTTVTFFAQRYSIVRLIFQSIAIVIDVVAKLVFHFRL